LLFACLFVICQLSVCHLSVVCLFVASCLFPNSFLFVRMLSSFCLVVMYAWFFSLNVIRH
jgi:hypothetical protein